MDQANTVSTAQTLLQLLTGYAAQNTEAAGLLEALRSLIADAIAGRIQHPVDWRNIPGARTFEETGARSLPGLEEAYAHFKLAITGGEPELVRQLRERRGH